MLLGRPCSESIAYRADNIALVFTSTPIPVGKKANYLVYGLQKTLKNIMLEANQPKCLYKILPAAEDIVCGRIEKNCRSAGESERDETRSLPVLQ